MSDVTYKFPEGFYWGTASSAPQTEGAAHLDGKGESIWDWWSRKEPDKFWERSTPEVACDFYHHYKDDIQMLKKTGHNSYRISLSWTRIIPNGFGAVNPKGLEFYHKLIDELLANGIEPFVNLYHFDIPAKLLKIGGWENPKVIDYFLEYARVCFKEFDGKVKFWFTHNEPLRQVEAGYLYGINYPQVHDIERTVQVAHHVLMANIKAISEFHRMGYEGKIGVIMMLSPAIPASDRKEDVEAAELADMLGIYYYLHPLLRGYYEPRLTEFLAYEDIMPLMEPGDLALMSHRSSRVDFLGVNYYHPRRIAAGPEEVFDHRDWYRVVELPDVPRSDRGWEIYPKGIYDLLVSLRKKYGNIPCMISENGLGVSLDNENSRFDGERVHDTDRIDYVREHLKYVHKAISEGMHVFGYHMWTGLDCYSWRNGYKNVYGLIRVDRKKNLERTIKDSGYWFKSISDNNGF